MGSPCSSTDFAGLGKRQSAHTRMRVELHKCIMSASSTHASSTIRCRYARLPRFASRKLRVVYYDLFFLLSLLGGSSEN